MSCILNVLYTSDHGLRDTCVCVTLKIEFKSTGLLYIRNVYNVAEGPNKFRRYRKSVDLSEV